MDGSCAACVRNYSWRPSQLQLPTFPADQRSHSGVRIRCRQRVLVNPQDGSIAAFELGTIRRTEHRPFHLVRRQQQPQADIPQLHQHPQRVSDPETRQVDDPL